MVVLQPGVNSAETRGHPPWCHRLQRDGDSVGPSGGVVTNMPPLVQSVQRRRRRPIMQPQACLMLTLSLAGHGELQFECPRLPVALIVVPLSIVGTVRLPLR